MTLQLAITEEMAGKITQLFSSPMGREVSEWLRSDITDVVELDTDPSVITFKAGRRQLALLMILASKATQVTDVDHLDKNDLDYTEGN